MEILADMKPGYEDILSRWGSPSPQRPAGSAASASPPCMRACSAWEKAAIARQAVRCSSGIYKLGSSGDMLLRLSRQRVGPLPHWSSLYITLIPCRPGCRDALEFLAKLARKYSSR